MTAVLISPAMRHEMLGLGLADVTRQAKNCVNRVTALNAMEIIHETRRSCFRHDPYAVKVLSTKEYATPKLAPTPVSKPTAAQIIKAAVQPLHATEAPKAAVPPMKREAPVTTLGSTPATEAEAILDKAPVRDVVCRVLVRFKRTEEIYASYFAAPLGELVSVEGDRGRDVGKVVGVLDKDGQYVSHVIGKATASEKKALQAIRDEEDAAVKLCQQRVKECGLKMKIEDVEYQLDGGKLTVFFTSPAPVDFRQLQRVLFRDFRCRVWLRTLGH